jgi:N-acetylneuraminate lyase
MCSKPNIRHITGVIPAMLSTFDEQEQLDLKRSGLLVEHLIASGVHGLYITGSTGEGFLMTIEERKRFAQEVVQRVNNRIPVIVHVGAISTKLGIELAQHAQAIGADAISSVPPFYYQYTPDEIFRYYEDLCSSVDLPMIVYNIALATLMGNDLVLRLATIDGVCGLKFTGTQHHDMALLKERLGPDFMVYSGCDEMATQGLLAGSDGLIGSFYNIIPDVFLKIYDLCQKGCYTQAMEVQRHATRFIVEAVRYGHFGVIKQLLTDSGVDVGPVRRPFNRPSQEVMDRMWAFIDGMHDQLLMDFASHKR